ncbi:hypothetical protein [Myxosarcina sp. GI1(2024)]
MNTNNERRAKLEARYHHAVEQIQNLEVRVSATVKRILRKDDNKVLNYPYDYRGHERLVEEWKDRFDTAVKNIGWYTLCIRKYQIEIEEVLDILLDEFSLTESEIPAKVGEKKDSGFDSSMWEL